MDKYLKRVCLDTKCRHFAVKCTMVFILMIALLIKYFHDRFLPIKIPRYLTYLYKSHNVLSSLFMERSKNLRSLSA